MLWNHVWPCTPLLFFPPTFPAYPIAFFRRSCTPTFRARSPQIKYSSPQPRPATAVLASAKKSLGLRTRPGPPRAGGESLRQTTRGESVAAPNHRCHESRKQRFLCAIPPLRLPSPSGPGIRPGWLRNTTLTATVLCAQHGPPLRWSGTRRVFAAAARRRETEKSYSVHVSPRAPLNDRSGFLGLVLLRIAHPPPTGSPRQGPRRKLPLLGN